MLSAALRRHLCVLESFFFFFFFFQCEFHFQQLSKETLCFSLLYLVTSWFGLAYEILVNFLLFFLTFTPVVCKKKENRYDHNNEKIKIPEL